MTTLVKINMGTTIARNVKQVNPTIATESISDRQALAAKGKVLPPDDSAIAFLEAKKKELNQAVKNVSGYVQSISRELNFSIDEELGRPIVTVVDLETGKVIRQIPTEDMLELSRTLSNAQERAPVGILFQGDA